MSYLRLIFDTHNPQARTEEFLHQVIFFIIKRCPARESQCLSTIFSIALFIFSIYPSSRVFLIDGRFDPSPESRGFCSHWSECPPEDMSNAVGIVVKLKDITAFGAKRALIDGAVGVSFDIDDFPILGVNVGAGIRRRSRAERYA